MTMIKNHEVFLKDQTEKISYSQILLMLLDQPIGTGITINEMRDLLQTSEKLKNASHSKEDFELTDVEINILENLIISSKWRVIDPEIIKFSDYFLNIN